MKSLFAPTTVVTSTMSPARRQSVEDALIAQRRNKLEMEIEIEEVAQGDAIRRSNAFRPKRPAGRRPPCQIRQGQALPYTVRQAR